MIEKTHFVAGTTIALILAGLCTLVHAAMAVPKGYVVAEITVTDPEAYKAYVAKVGPLVAHFGGKYLVRGGQTAALEGEPPKGRVVVIEFDNMQAARAFEESSEYAAVAGLRHKSATSRVFLVEGAS